MSEAPRTTVLPKILIIGRSGVGKSLFGHLLASQNSGWQSRSVSDVIIPKFAAAQRLDPAIVFERKSYYRKALIGFAEPIIREDPLVFVEECLRIANIVSGLRHDYEVLRAREFVDQTVFIEGPQGMPEFDSYDISRATEHSCDIYIFNDKRDRSELNRFAQLAAWSISLSLLDYRAL